MGQLSLNTDWSYRGLRVITLENDLLRLQILPEAGAKIWQITHLPHGADLLWNNPRIPPARHTIHTRYDDVWSGGWDELFPNDPETTIGEERYPDHGELWSGDWEAEPFANEDEVGVKLRFQTPVSAISVEKTIMLRPGAAHIYFTHCFRNLGFAAFPFLWKLHPAFNVTAQHRLDFPPMRVVREPAYPGTLAEAPLEFAWPYARMRDREVDLRTVPHPDRKQLYFFYGDQMKSGWCALTNTATRLSCGLRFDPAVFPSCWLFASYGGWRNYNVAVLEPCTGYPLNFDALVAAGRQRVLQPGESLSTNVLFTVQEGIASVSDIKENGVIVP
ncbi:MAG: aldose epimerase family protein [Acidobacteriaceae bacterium]